GARALPVQRNSLFSGKWGSAYGIAAGLYSQQKGDYQAMLETRRLGQSKLSITRVGVGTAPMGSSAGWRVYWGTQNEEEAMRAIEVAIELGVNWIDTAPFYGWGRAEEIVGKALRRLE